ncbi:MAG TPA: DUF3090 family protein [Ktedonobacteraceae bacterium]
MSTRDLGTAQVLGAEAIGQPGQRRFRLFARTRNYAAILWAEKQQLLDLSLVIDRLLAQASEGGILRVEAQAGARRSVNKDLPDDFPMPPDYDFQVGQLRLNFDTARATFILTAVPLVVIENERGELEPYLQSDDALSFQFTLEQARELTSRIEFLASSGRPVCPLCHTPLDGGPHACVKQNGHREIIQIIRDDEDEEE